MPKYMSIPIRFYSIEEVLAGVKPRLNPATVANFVCMFYFTTTLDEIPLNIG
jgi:hypothetical protein